MIPGGRNFGLDLMRAAAILMVVFAHYFASTPLEGGGLLGVEVFFVLSGFLIGDILVRSFQEEGATWTMLGNFWTKRWFRTLPNYGVFLFFHLFFVLLTTSQMEPGWYAYPFFLQNFWQPAPGFFRESWSLAVEEWFYLLFPLLAVILNGGGKLKPSALLATVAVFLVVPTILRGVASAAWDLQTIRMVVPLRLDTMMYGVLAAMIMNWRPRWWARSTGAGALLAAGALVLAGLFLVRHESRLSSVLAFPLIAVGTALTVPSLKSLPRRAYLLPAAIEYISKVSYSTYLLHMPLFFFLEGMISWGHTPMAIKLIGRLLMVTAALLLSYLPYRGIEQPFLALRQRWVRKAGRREGESS